jgi:hypothetical protein
MLTNLALEQILVKLLLEALPILIMVLLYIIRHDGIGFLGVQLKGVADAWEQDVWIIGFVSYVVEYPVSFRLKEFEIPKGFQQSFFLKDQNQIPYVLVAAYFGKKELGLRSRPDGGFFAQNAQQDIITVLFAENRVGLKEFVDWELVFCGETRMRQKGKGYVKRVQFLR